MKELRIAIVGTGFMGRAHSNAYRDVTAFFDLPVQPVMQVACGGALRADLERFAIHFGWKETGSDWRRVVERADIDVIDICTSNASHEPIAVAAARNGKHVICENPMARNVGEARRMLDAVKNAVVVHMVAHNYRRVPALVLAKQFIEQGKIGRIRHFNAAYYQDWLVDPGFPYGWRNDIKEGGSGAHGDMSSHTVDLARYLLGEFEAVNGMQQVFIKERKGADQKTYPVTADDATCFIAKFRNEAMGSFVSTRLAAGRKNYLRLEIFGSEGSLIFNLERLNELEYYSAADQSMERGFRNILVTDHRHPYVGFWWPPSHIIGWEHTFIHEIRDFLTAITARQAIEPDFGDGLRCQYVLDAVQQSARNGKWVQIPE